ncbi:MAG: FAD binding domain-containing protein [Gammaproteobacteria bacterium]
MYRFDYEQAPGIAEVVARLRAEPEAKVLAGGMTLLPTMKLRLAAPSALIDLTAIEALQSIVSVEDGCEIGAAVKHDQVARDAEINEKIPALASLANGIGDAQVRNRGTLGGSVANNDPAADYPAAVLALNATVITDRREIPADEFFVDMFETALDDDEIIIAIRFPIPDVAHYVKFPNPASRYALVGVFVARFGHTVRVAVTGAAPCVFRFSAAEQALENRFEADSLKGVSFPPADLNEDMHASAEYRAHLIGVLTRRALTGE